jgi:hypothetical protein
MIIVAAEIKVNAIEAIVEWRDTLPSTVDLSRHGAIETFTM